jgi:hypothetical protein
MGNQNSMVERTPGYVNLFLTLRINACIFRLAITAT